MNDDDWTLSFEGFDAAEEGLREALCTLGNGYFATRGSAPEAEADEVHYPGTYLSGGYNRLVTRLSGRLVENEDLVNFPSWLPLRFRTPDDLWVNFHAHDLLSYRQRLDMRAGVLWREVVYRDRHGRVTRLESRCLVSMATPHAAGVQLVITPENWSGEATVESGIRHGVVNAGVARYRELNGSHLVRLASGELEGGGVYAHVRTCQSRIEMAQAAWTCVWAGARRLDLTATPVEDAGFVGERLVLALAEGEPVTVEKLVAVHTSRDRASAGCCDEACRNPVGARRFDELAHDQARAWARLWRHADIRVRNDTGRHQRALRLHLFHLMQTVSPHSVELDVGVPARGWHGEAYRGHVFWDELFILPFFDLRFPDMARALLRYRYRRLPEARLAARRAGLRGALFPWQSASNGREETQEVHLNPRSGRWLPDNSRLQRHVNLAVAYNVWHYYQVTADLEFLRYEGGELVLEIARMLASLADRDPELDRFVIRGVLGPDEYHDAYPNAARPGIDNNAYTNVMTAWVMRCALDVLEVLPADARTSLVERLGIGDDEIARWDEMSRRMHVPFLPNGLLAQFDGYDELQEFDWDGYREKYGDIERLDRILEAEGDSPNHYKLSKQADVLMLFYLLTSDELAALMERLGYEFDPARIPETVRYYLDRTSHGSTLSAVVHAWVLARSDRAAGWSLFERALDSDLGDSQQGTTREGIHLGAMAATVDIVQRAYTGCAFRGGLLHLEPCLPDSLEGLATEIRYRSNRLQLEVTTDRLIVTCGDWSREKLHYYVRDKVFRIGPGESRRHRIPAR